MGQGIAQPAGRICLQRPDDRSVGDQILGPQRSALTGAHALTVCCAGVPAKELRIAVGASVKIDIEHVHSFLGHPATDCAANLHGMLGRLPLACFRGVARSAAFHETDL